MSDDATTYVGQLSPDRRWRWDGNEWTPAIPLTPAWARLGVTTGATWWVVAAVLVFGLVADQALRSGTFGLGATATLVLGAAAFVFASRVDRLEPRLLAAIAAAFAVWLSARASPWLLWPDLAASLLLLGAAASLAARGSLLNVGMAESAARSVHALLHGLAGAAWALRPLTSMRKPMATLGPIVRGLLIAAPVAILIAGLLASADPVFASFFNLDIDLGRLMLDTFYVAAGAAVLAGLLRLASAEPLEAIDGPRWRLGTVEGLVVLGVLDAVFAAFAIAQAIAAAGAAGDTLRAAGVTYADYARSGFFQLLWVAGITAAVLVLFGRITGFGERRGRIAFIVMAELAIALTLLIVAVASSRLSLYEGAYGFTMLRLYSHVFAGWIAVVFLLLALDLAGLLGPRRWLVGAIAVTAAALLMTLNLVNPESLVAGLNVDRAASAHKIDAQYLAELSNDSTPALLSMQSRLDPELWQQVRAAACGGPRSYAPGIAAYNWADADAATARRASC